MQAMWALSVSAHQRANLVDVGSAEMLVQVCHTPRHTPLTLGTLTHSHSSAGGLHTPHHAKRLKPPTSAEAHLSRGKTLLPSHPMTQVETRWPEGSYFLLSGKSSERAACRLEAVRLAMGATHISLG